MIPFVLFVALALSVLGIDRIAGCDTPLHVLLLVTLASFLGYRANARFSAIQAERTQTLRKEWTARVSKGRR